MGRTTLSLFVFLFCLTTSPLKAFDGSLNLSLNQRFFKDPRLSHVNGFSEWWALEFQAELGLCEFKNRIEPLVSLGFVKNSATLYALNSDGSTRLDSSGSPIASEEELEFEFYSFSAGARYKFWEPNTFFIIPFTQAQGVYRFGRVRTVKARDDQQRVTTGGDFGLQLGGGLIFSFLFDEESRRDLKDSLEVKDFGLMASAYYLPSGFLKHGLGLAKQTGGYNFGLGLYTDW